MYFKGEARRMIATRPFQLVRHVQAKVHSQRVLSLFSHVSENMTSYSFKEEHILTILSGSYKTSNWIIAMI